MECTVWNLSGCERVWRGVWRSGVSQFDVQVRCISFKTHECQDVQTSSWCQRLRVLSDVQSGSCYVPLGEMLDIDVLDPAKLPQRESKNDYGFGQS